MVGSLSSLLAASALLLAAPSPPSSRLLVAGPALAGSRVIWAEQQSGRSVLRAWPGRPLLWQSATSWFAGPLSGSASLIAFARSYDGCPGQAGVACPVETQTLAGPPRGSLRPLGPAERCVEAGPSRRLALSGSLVAWLALDCDGHGHGKVIVRGRRRTVFVHEGASCCDVALAGSYLAWRSGDSVDVFDLRVHRLAYRAAPPPGEPIAAFDVQADGKLALLLGPATNGHLTLAWRAARPAALHRLARNAVLPPSGPALRLVGGRIIAEAAAGAATAAELVATDLSGHERVLARFAGPVEQTGAIDATAEQATWASRQITSSRLDCPPPGQERPCRLLKNGIETIWLTQPPAGHPRPIARWAFTNAP